MLNLEDFMNICDLKQQGWSVSAIAEQLNLDRKTVRKYLLEPPKGYKRENPAPCKIDPYRPFLHFNPKFLQFAAYYGFVPRVCRPYRPETKGKIESTVRFVKQNFWPGISFLSLPDLNQQARTWMEKVNHQVHSTTREVPYQRLPQERLLLIEEQPDYDTGYMEHRRVAKHCMLSYRGNRFSVPLCR